VHPTGLRGKGAVDQGDLRPAGRHEVPLVDDIVRARSAGAAIFREALEKYFGGAEDSATLEKL
jgi:hypothetical protein